VEDAIKYNLERPWLQESSKSFSPYRSQAKQQAFPMRLQKMSHREIPCKFALTQFLIPICHCVFSPRLLVIPLYLHPA
jgi:hypothetical protein